MKPRVLGVSVADREGRRDCDVSCTNVNSSNTAQLSKAEEAALHLQFYPVFMVLLLVHPVTQCSVAYPGGHMTGPAKLDESVLCSGALRHGS